MADSEADVDDGLDFPVLSFMARKPLVVWRKRGPNPGRRVCPGERSLVSGPCTRKYMKSSLASRPDCRAASTNAAVAGDLCRGSCTLSGPEAPWKAEVPRELASARRKYGSRSV